MFQKSRVLEWTTLALPQSRSMHGLREVLTGHTIVVHISKPLVLREEAMLDPQATPMSARDWHVLMALYAQDLHGYGVMKAVERESGGKVSAEIGSLYRILDRLLGDGLIREVDEPDSAPAETRGRPRRYYGLTELGRHALRREAARLRDAVELARKRDLLPEQSR